MVISSLDLEYARSLEVGAQAHHRRLALLEGRDGHDEDAWAQLEEVARAFQSEAAIGARRQRRLPGEVSSCWYGRDDLKYLLQKTSRKPAWKDACLSK